MDIQKCKLGLLRNNTNLSKLKMCYNWTYITESFVVLQAMGNTKLKFNKRHFKTFKKPVLNDGDEKIVIYRCKFEGNYTKNYLYLFFEIQDGVIVNWYDCLDINKKQGSIPVCDFQIVCYKNDLGSFI